MKWLLTGLPSICFIPLFVYHTAKLLTHLHSRLLAGRACINNKFCILFTVCTKKVGFLHLVPVSFNIGCDSLVCLKIK